MNVRKRLIGLKMNKQVQPYAVKTKHKTISEKTKEKYPLIFRKEEKK